MVFIHLQPGLFAILRKYLQPKQFIVCDKEHYLAYNTFKRVAKDNYLAIHSQVRRADIIFSEEMQRIIRKGQMKPEQRLAIEQLKSKHEQRMVGIGRTKAGSTTNNAYYFESSKASGGVKELTDSVSFAMTFIFTFFMAGLTGYYFGNYFLNLPLPQSLMIALLFIVATIIIETTLFIIKQNKRPLKENQYSGRQKQKQDKKTENRDKITQKVHYDQQSLRQKVD